MTTITAFRAAMDEKYGPGVLDRALEGDKSALRRNWNNRDVQNFLTGRDDFLKFSKLRIFKGPGIVFFR